MGTDLTNSNKYVEVSATSTPSTGDNPQVWEFTVYADHDAS